MLAAALAGGCKDAVAPPVATQVALKDGNGQTATVGSPLSQPLRVTVLDAAENPVSGVAVEWSVITGGGSVSAPSVTTGADGVAGVTFTLGTQAGPQQAEAAVQGLAGSPVVFTATATPGQPPQSSLVVAAGGNNTAERFTSDLWVHGNYAYTGTWGTRLAAGNVIKVWQLSASGAPSIHDSVKITWISTVSYV